MCGYQPYKPYQPSRYEPYKVDTPGLESQSSTEVPIEGHNGVKKQPTGFSKKEKCGEKV